MRLWARLRLRSLRPATSSKVTLRSAAGAYQCTSVLGRGSNRMVSQRSLLAADMCAVLRRARNCANAADAFQEACYLTDNLLSPATCALSSACDLGPGTGENCSP